MTRHDGISAEILEAYGLLVATIPNLERRGKTMPYTSVNGHMFSFIDKSGSLSIRLPLEELESFLEKYSTTRSVQHGRVMKEYVLVPKSIQSDLKKLTPYFEISFTYTSALKPKPTKRKKS